MNEVEKMYEKARVLKECLSPCYINKTWRKTHDCPNCDNRENYPPFTAEKQLELIKWLGTTEYYTFGIFYHQGLWYIYTEATNRQNEKFDECLASLVNSLWQDLTEEEKQQIKNILESEVRE